MGHLLFCVHEDSLQYDAMENMVSEPWAISRTEEQPIDHETGLRMIEDNRPFTPLAPGLAMGKSKGNKWQPLHEQPLLILVGVAGVGKSTTEAALLAQLPALATLPNRRTLSDWLIIGALQQADGERIQPVQDRAKRFAYTRRYRQRYPGGMAQALSTLLVDVTLYQGLLLFDGLRGENEVMHAATLMPRAHFLLLDAPDLVRICRLLQRQDAFDQVNLAQAQTDTLTSAAVPELEAIFTPSEVATLRGMVETGEITPDELRAKLKIVAEERRNYNPQAAKAALGAYAPERTLIVDTVVNDPQASARLINAALINWGLITRAEAAAQ